MNKVMRSNIRKLEKRTNVTSKNNYKSLAWSTKTNSAQGYWDIIFAENEEYDSDDDEDFLPLGWSILFLTGLPYIDFYIGQKIPPNLYQSHGHCRHLYDDIFPTKRGPVYQNAFTQNFPANPDQLLRTCYGRDWKTPRLDKNPHGEASYCPHGPTYKWMNQGNGITT